MGRKEEMSRDYVLLRVSCGYERRRDCSGIGGEEKAGEQHWRDEGRSRQKKTQLGKRKVGGR